MLKSPDVASDPDSGAASRRRVYRGSALLDSCFQRFSRVLLVVALMWLLSGWAMDWW